MSIFSFFQLLLGLTFFLYGMHVMSANLEKMAGGKLEYLLKKMTANPFISLLLGAGITIAIQSSSATTVMLVGLVNSGIMQLAQTLYVIFGANIGTTLTSWILSLSGVQGESFWIQMLKPENFSPLFAFGGILLLMIAKSDKKKSVGTIFIGFAILMYGMEFMKNAVSPLAELPAFAELLVKFNNPLFGVLVGTLVTAVIQSSAASVGILQAISLAGGMTYGMAIPIVMGQNIGTCVTSLISCIGTNANAKRVAIVHLSLNVIGTAVCLSLYVGANALFSFGFSDMAVSPVTIALIHTIFNVAITALLMPFSKWIMRLAQIIVKDDKKSHSDKKQDFLLDDRLLRQPSMAISECDNYTVKMCTIADETLTTAMDMVEQYDEDAAARVLASEDRLDRLEDSLGTYLVKLSAQALSTADSQKISKMLHTIGDFERLGDHAVNLLKTAQEIRSKEIVFSPEATRELSVLTAAIREILAITVQAYTDNDAERAGQVEPLEQVIDRLTAAIKDSHIRRLQTGACTIELGFVLSDLLNNYERISDHCSNIAVAIIELRHSSFDTHRYLNQIKYGNAEFSEVYNEFRTKYHL